MNSTTVVAGKAGFTLASAAKGMVEFVAGWLNLYPRTVLQQVKKYIAVNFSRNLVKGNSLVMSHGGQINSFPTKIKQNSIKAGFLEFISKYYQAT